MHEDLTPKQRKILEFIEETKYKKGISPSYREIMEHFGFKSIGTVQDHLNALEKKGYIKREPMKYRSIGCRMVGPDSHRILDNTVSVPVVGQISAGKPVLAEENIEGYINVDRPLIKYSKDIFALKVKGDSMCGAGILNGDYVIVKKQPTVENRQIACVLIDNEATVKRFYRRKNQIELKPENSNYKSIFINKGFTDDVLILGKVIGVFRTLIPRPLFL